MAHADNLAAIMADHDLRDAARARNSRKEHRALYLLGKVCSHLGCYNRPSTYSVTCSNHPDTFTER